MVELIDAVIDGLIATAHPSSGANLSGFAMDMDHALYMAKELAEFRIRRTDGPRCLLIVEATVADEAERLPDVSRALGRIWTDTAYAGFQASACVRYREATVLRFATHLASANLFVTGRIVAAGGPYTALVDRFERTFRKLSGPLPPLPALD